MTKFEITKKIPLEYEGWKDCYLEFSLPSFGDLKDITKGDIKDSEKAKKALETIEKLFKSGFGMSEGKRIEVKKEDLKDIPVKVLTDCFRAISGEISPK